MNATQALASASASPPLNPFISGGLHANPEVAVKSTNMCVQDVTSSYANCAGSVYHYFGSGSGEWSWFRRLRCISPESPRPLNEPEWQINVVPEALRIGESVGRLVLLWQAPPSTGVLPQVRYSGVWLDDRFFLTCAHGLPRSSSRALCKETVRQLSVDENPWAYVFSENVFEHFVNDRDFRSRKVRLWEFNEENDLAIFRVSSSAERTSGPPGIGRNTLSSDQSDNQEADIPIFTIAYSNDDEPFVEDSEFSKERRSQNPEFHAKIASLMNHLGPQATVHQYMQQAYRQKLNETDKGRTIDATIDFTDAKSRNINQLASGFKVIFVPNERSLATGRLIPSSADILDITGATPLEDERSLTHEKFHTISTYFGCSGGPVVSVEPRGDEAAAAKVIGLLASGEFTVPANKMITFTTDGKEWILKSINAVRPLTDSKFKDGSSP